MNQIKAQLNIFMQRVTQYTINCILAFTLGCLGFAIVDRVFGIPNEYLGAITGIASLYLLFAILFFDIEGKILRGELSLSNSRLVMYINTLVMSPYAYCLMRYLDLSEIAIAAGVAGIFTYLGYYISTRIPLTQGQLRIWRYMAGYLILSFIVSMACLAVYLCTGYNLFSYVNHLFGGIVYSIIIIAFCIFGINVYIQSAQVLSQEIRSEHELETKATFFALQISYLIIRIFIELMRAMSRDKKR